MFRFVILTLLSISSITSLFSQTSKIITNSPVYIAALNKDKSLLAFADLNKVQVVQTSDYKKVGEWIYDYKTQGLITILSFHPKNKDLIIYKCSKYNGEFSPVDFNTYPADSFYFINYLTKKITASIAGNAYFDLSEDSNFLVAAYNEYFVYNSAGMSMFGAKKGSIGFYPQKREIKSEGIVAGIALSPDNKLFAVVYFDSLLKKGGSSYSIEIRNSEDFSVMVKRGGFTGKPTSMTFSRDNKYLCFEYFEEKHISIYDMNPGAFFKTDERIEILNVEDLKKPQKYETQEISPYISNNKLTKFENGNVVNIDLNTNEKKWTLWSNLSSLFMFNGFIPFSENEIIVFGVKRSDNGTADKKGCIEKLNLSDLQIYTESSKTENIDTLFDPLKIYVHTNSFNTENLRYSSKKDLMIGFKEKKLEVWSVTERKKLHEFNFDNEIYEAVCDYNSSTLLIIAKDEQMTFSGYRLNYLDLKTGTLKSYKPEENISNSFSPTYKCNCFPIPENEASWVCSDFSANLWEIKQNESLPKSIVSFDKNSKKERVETSDISLLPDNENLVVSIRSYNLNSDLTEKDNTLDSIVFFNLKEFKVNKINYLKTGSDYYFLNLQLAINFENRNLELTDLVSGKKQNLLNLPYEKLISVCLDQNLPSFYLVFNEKSSTSDSLVIVEISHKDYKKLNTFKLSDSKYHTVNQNGLNYLRRKELWTYVPSTKTYILWNKLSDIYLDQYSLSLDGSGKLLFAKTSLIDMHTLKEETAISSFYYSALLNGKNAGKIIYIKSDKYGESKPNFEICIAEATDFKNPLWRSKKFELKNDNFFGVNTIVVSPNGNYAAIFQEGKYSSTAGDGVWLLNLNTYQITQIEGNFIHHLFFSKDDKLMFLFVQDKNQFDLLSLTGKSNSTFRAILYDLENNKILKLLNEGFDAFGPSNEIVLKNTLGGVILKQITNEKLVEKKYYYAREWINVSYYLTSKNLILGGSDNGILFIWNPEKQSPVAKIVCGSGRILSITESIGKLFVLMDNAQVKVFDSETLSEQLTISFIEKTDLISTSYFTPEGFYSSSKENIYDFHFVKGGKAYPLSGYELFLNRPDIILFRLGFADKSVIDLYYAAYVKRLSKSGIKPETKIVDIEKPLVEIANKDQIPLSTANKSIEFLLNANDEKSGIKQVLVLANGVPVFKQDYSQLSKNVSTKVDIILQEGQNLIKVIAQNNNGLESDPGSFEIYSSQKSTQNIYFIGIGISNYADTNYNLKYGAKDAKDIASAIQRKYPEAIITLLLNENATKENIKSIKVNILNKTTVDDIVIVSFSGHGLVNEKYDFYYATYLMDFNQPQKAGLVYEDIEWLLDDIPARRKLVLMDACHSGEIDKEELAVGQNDTFTIENVNEYFSKGAGTVSFSNSAIGMTNTFTLMQELFANMNRGNGTVFITAAAGHEFAFEGDNWNNGVFTYSLLSGLLNGNADENKDKEISVNELKKYTGSRVQLLTKGLQKPTTRQENNDYNWKIW